MKKYDELHKEWDRIHKEFKSPTYQLRKKLILKILDKYDKKRKNLDILDVGCGTGDYSIELSNIGHHIVAFDISQYAIEKARSDCKELGIKNIEFKIDDVTKFNTDKKYDVIILSEVLEHLDNDLEILKKYSTYLKNDGHILCSVPYDPQLWSKEDEYSGHIRRYDIERINSLMTSSKLQLAELICYGFPLLRIIWSIRTIINFSKKPDNQNSKIIIYGSILRIIGRFIVFVDSFSTKGKNGIGLIFLSTKDGK